MVVVKVPKRLAESVIETARRAGALDVDRELVKEGDFVFIPLTKPVDEVVSRFEVVEKRLPSRVRNPRSVMEVLAGSIPDELLDKVPRSYDIVGYVAVVNDIHLPREYWGAFAEALMKVHRNVRTVLVKVSGIEGEEIVG